ncbi:Glycerol-3-phosphate 1-O-acyltransferase [Bertholletia excelsa]
MVLGNLKSRSYPLYGVTRNSSCIAKYSPNLTLLRRFGSTSRSFAVRSTVRRCAAVLCHASKYRGTAEMAEDKETEAAVVASSSTAEDSVVDFSHSRTFLDVCTEEDLLSGIRKEKEAGRLSSNVSQGMEELYHNYRKAVSQSGIHNVDQIVIKNMRIALDRILKDEEDPFLFPAYHKAIRKPFDYYMFMQNYFRPLIDFRKSFVGNISLFKEMEEKLKQGHNIVLISNHQTEADPAIIALLLEATHPQFAENMIYVAGDRVVNDPLCKPFSMGRNLLCVYSKRHINDIPEHAEMKLRANTKSIKELILLLRYV